MSCTPPTRILVLRHGESEWNATRRWQGHADPPLSEEGVHQAVAAADCLGSFDALWASDLQRASLTAGIIAEIIGIGPVSLDPRLRETHVGPWEGLTHDEIEQRWPGFLTDRRRPAGFETDDLLGPRLFAVMADIASGSPAGEVLVVSHSGVIRGLRRLTGADDCRIANLGGSWFSVSDGDITTGATVNLIGAEPTGMVL